jgi:hypothetical protein
MSKAAATDCPPETPRRPRWRRRLRIGAIAVLCMSIIGVGCVFYALRSAEGRWQRLLRDLDRDDPGWRLEELEASRRIVPPEENSARQIDTVLALGIGPWPRLEQQEFDAIVGDLPPHVQLPERAVQVLRRNLTKSNPALLAARKLSDMPYGRFAITYSADGISTPFPHAQSARQVARLLTNDVLLRCAEGDIDGALASVRGALNVGRSLYDEPSVISQLVRMAYRARALRRLERALAQGEASEAALAALEDVLNDEQAQPLLLIAMRGERALMTRFIEALRAGEVSSVRLQFGKSASRFQFGSWDVEDLVYQFYLRSSSEQQAALLNYMNALVEIGRVPVEAQVPQIMQLESTLRSASPLVKLVAPSMVKPARAVCRTKAMLRCTIVAMALERYRLSHGRWPDSLAALVPEYIPWVPTDPYDGAPLRFRRKTDRVVVYSVGVDGQDNDGNVGENPYIPGTDIGFRLWDVNRRRQRPNPWSALRSLLWKPYRDE